MKLLGQNGPDMMQNSYGSFDVDSLESGDDEQGGVSNCHTLHKQFSSEGARSAYCMRLSNHARYIHKWGLYDKVVVYQRGMVSTFTYSRFSLLTSRSNAQLLP